MFVKHIIDVCVRQVSVYTLRFYFHIRRSVVFNASFVCFDRKDPKTAYRRMNKTRGPKGLNGHLRNISTISMENDKISADFWPNALELCENNPHISPYIFLMHMPIQKLVSSQEILSYQYFLLPKQKLMFFEKIGHLRASLYSWPLNFDPMT